MEINRRALLMISMIMVAITGEAQWQIQPQHEAPSPYVPKSPTADLTPTAMSFQRYGDIPVSLYTGTPNISIPLGVMRNGHLSIPVELSYHAGGVKPDERPGPVGLGWTLTLGGAITRAKRNFPDELDQAGFLYRYGLTSSYDIHPEYINAELYKKDEATNPSWLFIRDTEPDKFMFNFMGYSGFFMLDNHGKWTVSCDRPLQLVSYSLIAPFNINQGIFSSINSPVFNTFVLQGDDGTLYTFGGNSTGEYAIDLSINFMMQNSDAWEANAWYLTEIKHPSGENITFTYYHPGFSANFFNNSYGAAIYNPDGSARGIAMPSETQGTLTYPAHLKQVDGANFKVRLNYSLSEDLDYDTDEYVNRLWVDPQDHISTRPIYFGNCWDEKDWKRLVRPYKIDQISMTTLDSRGSTKVAKLKYMENPDMRLMLEGVELSGYDGKAAERYGFRYHHPEKMPRYLAKMNDHWGYYNGGKSNLDSIFVTNESTYKEQLFGSLREVIYPTGGKTVFEFEPNRYSRQAFTHTAGDLNEVDEQLAGRLRIKKIINVPNDNSTPEVREFYYLRNFKGDTLGCKSSGILECPPLYEHYVLYFDGSWMIENSETPLTNIINPAGFHIGYQEVVETNSSGGYKVSRFSSAADIGYKDDAPIDYSINLKYLPVSSRASYRGRLMSESSYRKDGKILHRREIDYGIPDGVEKYIHSLNLNRLQLEILGQRAGAAAYVTYSLYKNYVFQLREKLVTESVFGEDADHPIVTRSYYRYNNRGQMKCDSTVTMRQGQPSVSRTCLKYRWEEDPLFAKLNYCSYPAEITRYNRGKKIGVTAVEYGINGEYLKSPYVKSVRIGSPSRGQVKTLYTCAEVDELCRPLLVCDAEGRWTAYLWLPFHFIPYAEIHLGRREDYKKIKALSSSMPHDTDDVAAFITLLRQSLPDALIADYEYSLMYGVTAISDAAGLKTTYGYDNFGRLVEIRDNDGSLRTGYRYSVWSADN